MKYNFIISGILSVFNMTTPSFISRLFQEPVKEEYYFSDLNEIFKDVEWQSYKEDSKNIQKDRDNLNSDMQIAILDYNTKKKNGQEKS